MGEQTHTSSTPSPSLLIFTSFSNPLPRKYPHPHKPSLLIPPLIHRTLHTALDQDPPSVYSTKHRLIIPRPDGITKHDLPPISLANNTSLDDRPGQPPKDAAITLDTSQPLSNLAEDGLDRSGETDAEVTVKLHLVGPSPPSTRLRWIVDALDALGKYKGLGQIDTLLVGFKGVDYKGKKSAVADLFGCGAEGLENGSGGEVVDPQTAREVEEVWRALVSAKSGSTKGHIPNGHTSIAHAAENDSEELKEIMRRVKSLGTLYLPLGLLETFSEEGQAPCINSMDTPDCHHLPKEYSDFARQKGIELWAGGGGEGSDPMPSAELHNVLQEFNGTLAPLLPLHDRKRPILEQLIPLRDDGLKYEENAKADVCVDWVLGYTLVSKTRNVLKDKGYIVSANWKV